MKEQLTGAAQAAGRKCVRNAGHLPSTVPGALVLAFLIVLVWLNPSLAERPEMLIPLAAGLLAVFGVKGRSNA